MFHADEIFATVILAQDEEINLARVFRVPEDISAIIYDIGGGNFDHHQKGGNGCRENDIPYAACGLIWNYFGKAILFNNMNCPGEILDKVWEEVDRTLIQGIDAVDNGKPCPKWAIPVSKVISTLNPNWDSEETADAAFLRACELANTIFTEIVSSVISKVKAETIVESAVEEAENHIMILDRFVPWTETIFNIPDAEEIWYVIFPSNRGGFNMQCVPDAPGSFGQRHPIPEEWRGNASATGIDGCTFVHNAGFIAACDTQEAAINLAKEAARR